MVPISSQTAILLAGSIGLFLVALATIPAASSIASRLVRWKQHTGYQSLWELYQDEDGSATEESMKAFSDRIQRWSIACCAATGFLLSLALVVVGAVYPPHRLCVELWLQIGIWVSLVIGIRLPRAGIDEAT
jgi:hypothetical protein